MSTTVGLIGLGFIGASIGERLVATGEPPLVHDLARERVDALVASGAVAAASAAELAACCDVVLVCVQTDQQCLDVLGGDDGLLAHARPGTVVAVLSTISPDTVAAMAEAADSTEVDLLEVPMAGQGAKSVADGSMFVLAGGDPGVVERARPVLERFARVIETGPLGSGAALKLAHNVMVYVSRIGTLEAVELARAAGVRDGLVAELTAQTGTLSEQSRVWLGIYEARLRGETDPVLDANMVTAADLFAKDLGHAVHLGHELGVEMAASAAAIPFADQVYLVRDHEVPPAG
jgi:3-hydroxyisobutyrate dehydrogenase-like beta-hydroxyacid dehydrogenase